MTLQELAVAIINDPAYRQSIVARAAAGTLPEEVELAILDAAANRMPPRAPHSAVVMPFKAVEGETR
jgi:hypothetical protein